MSHLPKHSERAYYDSFFTSSEAGALDVGIGFRALRVAQADYLRNKIQSMTAAHTILSVGCGNGEIEMLLANPHRRLFACDLSFSGPTIGHQRAALYQVDQISFGQASLINLPLATDSCDVILALSVLHHIGPAKRAVALHEMCRVLRVGGCFIAYDPNKWRVIRLAKFLVRQKYDGLHSPDEEELSPTQMQRLAQDSGFQTVSVEFFDFFIDPLIWLFPNMPPRLFRMLYQFDRALTHLPGKQFASNFFLIGYKRLVTHDML